MIFQESIRKKRMSEFQDIDCNKSQASKARLIARLKDSP